MSILFDSTMQVLQRSMDASAARQAVTASNVANLDTPGYTPKDVDFDAALDAARAEFAASPSRTNDRHLGASARAEAGLDTFESPDLAPGPDGNSVDLDTQMSRMAETAVLYQASARSTSKKMALLRYVVSEGAV